MKSAYLSGPMRGHDLYNAPAFDAASRRLRRAGWEVLSPAEHDRAAGFDHTTPLEEQDFDLAEAWRWDLWALLQVDAIYMLCGWETSVGAGLEHRNAVMLGLEVLYESEETPACLMA